MAASEEEVPTYSFAEKIQTVISCIPKIISINCRFEFFFEKQPVDKCLLIDFSLTIENLNWMTSLRCIMAMYLVKFISQVLVQAS